ncbi:hypothetical protein DMJ88_22030 [Salmonella enterica]|nr:hypothetical protein [Salmonella enterica]
MALTGGNLFSTNVLIIASCSFDSNHPYNPQVSSWICPYISRHLLSLNPLLACCRRYSRGER